MRKQLWRQRQKRRRKRQALVLGTAGLAAAVVIAGGFLWRQGTGGRTAGVSGTDLSAAQEGRPAGAEAVEPESGEKPELATEPQMADISVEGIRITGMTREEAAVRLREEYSGTLEVRGGEETVTLINPVEEEIDRLLEQAYVQPEEPQNLRFDRERISEHLKKQVEALAASWNRSPENSRLASFDKATGVYEYTKEQSGHTLAEELLTEDLLMRIDRQDYGTPVEAIFSEVLPERTQVQTKAAYRVMGTFTTRLTNNKNRNQNVRLAADAIDGKVLQPGEEFSFNGTTGNRTGEKGYQPAGAYRNGVLVEEPGGGVCQVSTTLYHAIIKSGFKTTERNAHSYAPSYVEKGQDAMVSFDGYDGPDLKFCNTGQDPVVLRASMQGLELKVSIVGLPVLEEGMGVSIRSEKLRDVEPPAPVYEEDGSLPYGTEQVVEPGQNGSVWKSYRVYTQNGSVVKEEPLHNSSYKPKAAQVKRNTTVPTETDGGAVDGGAAEGGAAEGSAADGGTAEGSAADGGTADDSAADGSTAVGGTADGTGLGQTSDAAGMHTGEAGRDTAAGTPEAPAPPMIETFPPGSATE